MPRKIVLFFCAGAALIAATFAALVGYTAYANGKSDQAARDFCGRIQIGSGIDDAIAASAQDGRLKRVESGTHEYRFVFQGGIFHAGICSIHVTDRKIVSVSAKPDGD